MKFTTNGIILDTEVIYLTDLVMAATLKKSNIDIDGFRNGVIATCIDNGYEYPIKDENMDAFIATLKPIGKFDNSLVIEESVNIKYEIGKMYAFSDRENAPIEQCTIKNLTGFDVNDDGETVFLDSHRLPWEFIQVVDPENLGLALTVEAEVDDNA